MNLKRKIKILIIAIAGVCIGTTFSNAAIEIKPGTTVHTQISATTSYGYCYNMRAFGSSLGANNLDPHLSTMLDWGATAYLGLSGYGYIRNADGQTVTIGNANYLSTTKNATGVMNMGRIQTQTSYYKSGFESTSNGLANNTKELRDNKNTKYVDIIDNDSPTLAGSALLETAGWFNSTRAWSNGNYIIRYKILGYSYTVSSNYSGGTHSNVTYRPVIWN